MIRKVIGLDISLVLMASITGCSNNVPASE